MSYILPTSELLHQFFHLDPETIKICDRYYILYWESRHLYSQLLHNNGRVMRDKVSYTPVFQDSLEFLELGNSPEMVVKLSFRRLKGKSGGIVIIKRTRKILQEITS